MKRHTLSTDPLCKGLQTVKDMEQAIAKAVADYKEKQRKADLAILEAIRKNGGLPK